MRSFIALLATAVLIAAQQYDPRADFCRRFSHDSAVVGDRLYINDGQLNLAGRGGKNFTNDRLLWHDLTTTTLDGQAIDMPPLMTNLSKPATVPNLIGATMWADQANARLFQFGGEFVAPAIPDDPFLLWSYDVYHDSWATRNPNQEVSRVSYGAGTTVEYLGMGYYLGGWMNSQNDLNWEGAPKASNKLVEYDMVGDTWQNRTGPNDQLGRAEGVLVFVPAGDMGMLVHFGGVRLANRPDATVDPAPMNVIDIYDIGNGRWYQQNATGDIPNMRRRFCGGAAVAADGSSTNIYIYGGLGFGSNSTGYDDAYILTIPSFTWIQIFPDKGVPRKPEDEYPHYDLTCNVIKNSQLLIIGGQFPKDLNAVNCDSPKQFGVHNLVMSKVDRGTESVYWAVFDPSRDQYSVPQDIIAVIGGDSKGNAQIKTPAKGNFDFADVGTLFRRTITPTLRAPTRTAPAVPGASKNSNSTTTVGAFSTPAKRATILVPSIVGGVAIVALATWFILRYRKQKRHAETPPGYKQRDPSMATEQFAPIPYSPPSVPPSWGYQPPPGNPDIYPAIGYAAHAYSDYSTSSQTPRIRSPAELPLEQTPAGTPMPPGEYGGWAPPPLPISPRDNVVPGHYPPPLPDEYSDRSPEMKERPRGEGTGTW